MIIYIYEYIYIYTYLPDYTDKDARKEAMKRFGYVGLYDCKC